MAFVKKILIFGIIMPIFGILLMSYNVSAFSFNLDDYDIVKRYNQPNYTCTYGNNDTSSGSWCATTPQRITITSMLTSDTSFSFKSGDYLTFILGYYAYDRENEPPTMFIPNLNVNLGLVDIEELSGDLLTSFIDDQIDGYSYPWYGGYKFVRYTYRAFNNIDLSNFGYSTTNTNLGIFRGAYYRLRMYSVFQLRKVSGSTDQQNEVNSTNNAIDESEDAGDSSSSSAEGASASLLSAITGFFGVITSASPSNCVINAPLNTYFGNQRLNVDLCSLDLPPQIGALTSIIAIGIIIPFAIHMFKKFINLFRSFQS